jgi:translation initiation factor 3 subunit L
MKAAHTILRSDIVGEYGQRPLYRMLGYFSIIGLLRVHVLLGDFTLGLKVMENVELNQKASYVSPKTPINTDDL